MKRYLSLKHRISGTPIHDHLHQSLGFVKQTRGDEGGEIRQDALDECWVVMAALGLEAKALWEKRKKRGTSPLWDQIRIPFSRLSISMLLSQSYLTLCEPMDS